MSPWSPPEDAVEWTPPSNAISADDTISTAEKKKVAAYTQIAERLSRTPPLGIGEHATALSIPEEDRGLFAAIAEKQYNADQSMKKVGYGTRLATSVAQGGIDWGMPLAKMVGAVPKLTPDQERYKQHLLGIRQSTDPTIRPDTNVIGRGVQQVGQMAFPMVQAVGAGKALGSAAVAAGLGGTIATLPLVGKVTGAGVATGLGVSGSFLPQTADQTYTSLIGEGVHPDRARLITAVSAPIEAGIESILPDPLSGYGMALRGTARQVAAKFLKHATANFTKELSEEALQGIVNETALEVGRMGDSSIPDKGFGNILMRGLTEMQQAALPLAMMMAPGASVGAVQTSQAHARISQLKEIRAKGYVSAEDGQLVGIAGETRKQRMANADAEIKQLEQEIPNASTVPSPEAEVRQPESRQDLRGQGQNQGAAEPASEVAQVRVEPPKPAQPDERQANRDAIAAAEALVPPEQPKRDVSAEILDALAQGPVTVSTPKVQGGLKVSKVRDDGRVVSNHGKIITPDETWVINQPKTTEAPAASTEVKTPQIGSKLPDNAVTPAVEKPATQPEPIPPQEVVQPPQPVAPPKNRGLKEQAAPAETTQPKRGEIGGKLAAGEVVLTSSGRPTTPFPPFNLSTGRKATNSVRNVDAWLHQNAIDEAKSRGDDYNLTMFSGESAKNLPQASKDSMEQYLFGEQPSVPRPFTKPLASPEPTTPAAEKPVEPAVETKPEPIPAKPVETPIPNERREHVVTFEKMGLKKTAAGKPRPTPLIKELANTVAEFRYDPTLVADKNGNLVFRDGSKFTLNPEQFGLGEQRVGVDEKGNYTYEKQVKPGDVVRVDLASMGVKPATEHDVVTEALKAQGFSNVKQAKGGIRASWKGHVIEAGQLGKEQWKAAGSGISKEAVDRANQTIERIRWSQPGDTNAGPSKGKLGPSLGTATTANSPKQSPAPTGKSSWREGVEAMLPGIAADPKVAAAVKAIKDAPKVNDRGQPIHTDWKPLREAIIAAGYKGTDLAGFAADVESYTVPVEAKPAKAKKAKPTKLQQAADDAVQEANAELEDFGKKLKGKGLASNPMLDPEVIAGAGRVVAKFVKAGTLKFAALIEHLAKSIGQAAVDRIRPALESEWDRLQKTDSSMEQRTPEAQAEPQPVSGDDLTSIKKEIVNEMREKVGLPEMEGSTPQTVEEWAENARITLASDPKAAIRLVNELANSTRPISQSDVMLLQFRYRQLANELAPVVDDYFEAVKSKDPVAITTAKGAVADARKAMTDFEETIHPSKETWGRTGVALQQMLRKDFSVEAVLRRGQEANDGEELSPDQTAELTAMAKKFQDLQSQFEAQRKKSDELEAELASKRQHEEAVTSVKQEKVRRKSDKRQAAEKKVAAAWEKFRQAAGSTAGSSGANLLGPAVDVAKAYVELGYVHFSEFIASVRQNIPQADDKLFRQAWDQVNGTDSTPLDPSDRVALSKLARDIQRELVESGMTDREQVIGAVHEALQEEIPDVTRRQTMDALSRYGIFQRQSQDQLEKLIRGMNSEILKLSQIDQMETAMKRVDELRAEGKTDEEIGKALDKEKLLVEATGLVRDRPSQTVRQLTQKYNELKKSIPPTTAGKAGMLQTTLNQMERALKNRISDLRFEIDRREKVVKEKRERPTSETIKTLEAERDSLVKIHKEMFPPKKPSEAQRIASAIRGSDKAIAQLEKQIATQDFDVEARPGLSSPELDARRARLEQLRAARKALKAMEVARMEGEGGKPTGKVPLSDAELARRAYESSLRSRIADYQQILAEGDFAPKPKKQPRTLTDSELKLRRQMEDVRHEVLQKYADYHLAHLKGIAWTADKLAEASRLSRALMTFVDLPLLRQGGVITAGRPIMAAKVMKNVVEEIAGTFGGMKVDSRQAEFNLMHKLREGPEGEFMQKSGLQLPSSDEKITRQEEAFQGRWAKWVPGVSLGGRLYTMIMNTLRVHEFRTLVDSLGSGGKATPSEGKLLAHFVNVAAGRSDLKGVPFLQALEQQAHLMNEVYFASRWVMSRFQLLALPGYLPFRGGLKNDWRAKRVIYKEMGRQMAGTAAVLGIVALAAKMFWDDDDKDKPRVGVDPTSSDFLKIVVGESRIDLLYGLSQIMVLSSRIGLQKTTSSVSGKTRKFGEGFEPETTLSTLERFGRTKLAPVPGAITTIANNWTNVVGQPETPLSLGAGMFAPISLLDVYRTMQSERVPKAVALAIIGELGASVSTYGPRTQFVTGNADERKAQIEKDLKNMHWDSPEQPAYSEFLTSDQLEQFRQRRQEKRGLVVYNATYTGKDEDEIKTRDKNREHLDEMGVSQGEAAQLLREYYKSKEHGLRIHGGTGLKPGYIQKLGSLNSIYGK